VKSAHRVVVELGVKRGFGLMSDMVNSEYEGDGGEREDQDRVAENPFIKRGMMT
jgi:hypothetical protein